MVESKAVPETKSTLSTAERLKLIQSLNALPGPQFEELLVALNPPKGNIPSNTAAQANRSKALFEWVESSIGPGIPELENVLRMIIATQSQTAEEFLSFAISGKISSKTVAEVRAIVKLLRKKTGDDSIDVAFFKEGSIKIFLSGSSEGLKQVQELFESGELEDIGIPPIESVHYVDNNTDARKARFIEILRLKDNSSIAIAFVENLERALISSRTLNHVLTRKLYRGSDLALVLTLNSDLRRAIISALDFKDVLKIDNTLEIDNVLEITNSLDQLLDHIHYFDLTTDIDFGVDFDIGIASNLTSRSTKILEVANARVLEIASISYLQHNGDSMIDPRLNLKDADLNNTNLRNITLQHAILMDVDFTRADLTGADLTGANLTRANLTEAVFRNITLKHAILMDVDFTRADLTGANLTGANLTGANLTGAVFRNITLKHAILMNVDFTRADLTGANLIETNLTKANLTEANVTETVFGENSGLTEADKLDLQQRGAIFQEPPSSSDRPSLVPA